MRVASHLGMSLAQLGAAMPAAEVALWIAWLDEEACDAPSRTRQWADAMRLLALGLGLQRGGGGRGAKATQWLREHFFAAPWRVSTEQQQRQPPPRLNRTQVAARLRAMVTQSSSRPSAPPGAPPPSSP